MHHSATVITVVSPSAIFDENVERESIILGISARELRGYETRTRIFRRRTRWKKGALPGIRDREKRESEKKGAEKDEESGTKTRIDQSRVGWWRKGLDGGIRSSFHVWLGGGGGGKAAAFLSL